MDETPLPVAAVEEVGPDTVAIEFESPPDFAARPGQFVKLTTEVNGQAEPRFYTISSPDVADTFQVTVGVDPDGDVGPVLRSLSAGDEVVVSGPFGNAYYEDEPRVLVLAGGPGVGPAVGIAERALADGNGAAVVYRDETPVHEQRLAALANDGADITVLGPADSLTEAVADTLTGDTQAFVYGFGEFLDDATAAVEAAGGDPDAAKVENFG
ncbi:MAG: ferredoxin-NADP reductase [Natronomonas sp.]|jgi:ferredoxin-NADP reductase